MLNELIARHVCMHCFVVVYAKIVNYYSIAKI